MQQIYTAALVGCGRIGYSLGLDEKREQPASHTMALRANPRIRLVAGCDSNPLTLLDWHAANRGTLVYRNSSLLYQRGRPDIVVVAVNENCHRDEAEAAIVSRPRLVVLEKPVALNMAQAQSIRWEAERNGVPVLVNHERRFADDYRIARGYLANIGAVQGIHATLASSLCVYDPRAEDTGAYSLIHDGTHLVDIVLYFLEALEGESSVRQVSYYPARGLLGRARQFRGETRQYVNTLLHHPVVTGVFRDARGVVRQLSAHYRTASCPDVTITMSGRSRYFGFGVDIQGTEGRICIGNGYLSLYRRQQSSLYSGFYSLARDESVPLPDRTGYFANMVQNAVDFLDGGAPLASTLQTGINALAVLEEIKSRIQ